MSKNPSSKVLGLDSPAKRIAIRFMKPFANKFILLDPKNKVQNNRVNLNYWDGKPNLGDAISPLIVNHMLEKHSLSLSTPVSSTRHLCAVGSVVTAGIQDCTVWGSGVLYTTLGYRLRNRKLDIRAVRGPLSRVVLLEYGYNVPEVYGDPAVFLPEVYNPNNITKRYRMGVVAHKNGSSVLTDPKIMNNPECRMIDIKTRDYKAFVDELLSVECVASSSLHGVILAESYGIPAVLVRPDFSMLKYHDWYYATGRLTFPVLESAEEVLSFKFGSAPDLSEMRSTLQGAFPYDLFD